MELVEWLPKCSWKFFLNTNFCVCTSDVETSLGIILAAAACVYGIGAVLLRKNGWKPAVTNVTRTLLLAERNYIQIEKEEFEIFFTIKDSTEC